MSRKPCTQMQILLSRGNYHPDNNDNYHHLLLIDFNKANFRTIAPKYFQHITINTRGDRVLDHCYSPFRDAYYSLPRPPFGKSDHSSVLLLPAYRRNVKHPPSGQYNAGRTNRTLHYRTVLITWTGTCSGQRLMTT